MIEILQVDEYGSTWCVEKFLTIEDAEDALYNLECALEDARTAERSYRLEHVIADLREQIEEHKQAEQHEQEDQNEDFN